MGQIVAQVWAQLSHENGVVTMDISMSAILDWYGIKN
jgi:hypothetical protein